MFETLAAYLHDLDPVIFSITEKLKLRWYGLSYVAGFAAAYYFLLRLSRRGLWVVEEKKVADVVTVVAIFGVFLGGRIGYVLFYLIPRDGWGPILENPLLIVAVWEGGMASHGGILGMMLTTLFLAWKNHWSWPALGDGFCIVAPLGVFFGRVANFINGELYGVATDEKNWWAVKFPKELYDGNGENLTAALKAAALEDPDRVGPILDRYSAIDGEFYVPLRVFEEEIMPIARENEAVLSAIGEQIGARHPSQLYEGLLEGLLIFVVLMALRLSFRGLWHGVLAGIFFLMYAFFRILVENVREPDAERIMGVTKGQFYSFFMILIGVGFLVYAWRSRRSFGVEGQAVG